MSMPQEFPLKDKSDKKYLTMKSFGDLKNT